MPHLGQELVLEHPARFKVVACGRRWGKTELGKTALLLKTAWDKKRGWWLAPTQMMASQVWRDLKASVRNQSGIVISESERRIDFAGAGMIAVRSAHHPDNLRGEGLDLAVLDEAAYMEHRVWPEIVRPMLTTSGAARSSSAHPSAATGFGINTAWAPTMKFQNGRLFTSPRHPVA